MLGNVGAHLSLARLMSALAQTGSGREPSAARLRAGHGLRYARGPRGTKAALTVLCAEDTGPLQLSSRVSPAEIRLCTESSAGVTGVGE